MLELQALGGLELRAGDEPMEAVLDQPREAALLVYLILDQPGLFHQMDSLAALFWPDLDPGPAREALDGSLGFLGRELPAGLMSTLDDGHVGVTLRHVECDVYVFEDAVAAGRWEKAASLYHGDLMDGVVVPDVAGFGSWLAEERDRLRTLAVRARRELDRGDG